GTTFFGSVGVSVSAGSASATFGLTDIGVDTYTIEAVYSDSGASANFNGSLDATHTLTVSPAHLTVTGTAKRRLCSGGNPALDAAISAFANGETLGTSGVTGSASCGVAGTVTSASPVGGYTITCTIGTLAATNYDFPAANFATGTLTVSPAHLTVTANAKGRLYGGSNPAFDATISAFANGENLGTSGVTGSASCGVAGTVTSASPVGGRTSTR